MMEIKTTLTGVQPINHMLMSMAPAEYLKGLVGWLVSERGKFTGDRKRDGSFRRTLARKNLSGRSGKWSPNVYRQFKGYITGENKIQNLKLDMGVAINHPSPFTEGIAQMEEGFSRTSSNWMILPIYENLSQRFSITGKFAQHKKFKEMLNAGQLEIISKKGRLYYFEAGSPGRLLWVGAHNITVKDQFDFYDAWEKQIPGVIDRGQKIIDRQTEKIAKS
jgi:hypothetical protein